MRVVVSGAGGLIGAALTRALRDRGDVVVPLTRGAATPGVAVTWDPARGEIDTDALSRVNADAVVHLAGESLNGRWTHAKRGAIFNSRVDGTTLLARTLAGLDGANRPATLICASATGIYGTRGDELLTEQAAPGDGFLADVVRAWEAAADPARAAGVRTAHLRMGPVIAADGGALAAMLPAFRLGAGGRLGSGQQWFPWVSLRDVVAVYLRLLDDPGLSGALNVVGPTPVRNAEFTKVLGRALRRPTVLPTPIPLMKLALGSDMVDEMLLVSQKVVPARLEALDFAFADRTIDAALATALR